MTPDQAKRLQARLGVAADGALGPVTYIALFRNTGARDAADELGRGAAKHFPAYRIETPLRIAHWLAQFGHESADFTRFEESLSYSAKRLCAVWPSRFPTLADALPFAANPEKLAERVYGRRMGNVNSGDGWRYRGRGPQLTGADNYRQCAARTGLDLVNNPALAADPAHFVHIACDFWAQHCLNDAADKDDLETITVRINGGRVGIEERRALLTKAKRILGI